MRKGSPMGLLLATLGLAVAANVLYHVAQKSVPADAHPLASLLVTYAAAIVVTLLLWPLYPGAPMTLGSFRALNWSSAAIGVSIVGIELGVLLAYRAGWRVSVLSTAINVALALILVPVGFAFFHERLSVANGVGLVLCLAGLLLLF